MSNSDFTKHYNSVIYNINPENRLITKEFINDIIREKSLFQRLLRKTVRVLNRKSKKDLWRQQAGAGVPAFYRVSKTTF